jgi:hypothetical protein
MRWAVQDAHAREGVIMNGRASLVGVVALLGLGFGLAPTAPAVATGAGNVEFTVGGTLPKFPCDDAGGCPATFSGTGTGAGNVTTMIGSVPHVATFAIRTGTVAGSARYSEPGGVFCPVFGFANTASTGSVTISGGADGIIHRVQTGPTVPGGSVTNVSFTLAFNYTRVGVNARIEITGGSVTLDYYIPATGGGTITQSIVVGEGHGVFVVNLDQAQQLCTNPGSLGFTLIGDAAIAVN